MAAVARTNGWSFTAHKLELAASELERFQTRVRELEGELAKAGGVPVRAAWPSRRGSPGFPCESCGGESEGNTLVDGWFRCNACGYPGK